MNEVTWKHVVDWEQLHCEECKYPTLLHFRGRPDDLRSVGGSLGDPGSTGLGSAPSLWQHQQQGGGGAAQS